MIMTPKGLVRNKYIASQIYYVSGVSLHLLTFNVSSSSPSLDIDIELLLSVRFDDGVRASKCLPTNQINIIAKQGKKR